jgi:hypothetical protein
MVTVVLVCTGNKYDEWYVDNILHMIREHGKLKYENVYIIRDGEGAVFDKLQMFKECVNDVNYLYFDLDIIIKGPISHLIKDDFTLLTAWWRDSLHTPLNSSIMSWKGNHVHIYDKFYEDEDYSRVKYWKGIDEYIYREIDYKIYDKVCWSYPWNRDELEHSICLFNHDFAPAMKTEEWTKKYRLLETY